MDFLFFISDFFLWILVIGLVIWVIVLGNKVATLDSALKTLTKRLTFGSVTAQISKETVHPVPTEVAAQPQPTVQTQAPAPSVQPKTQVDNQPKVQTESVKNSMPASKKSTSIESVFLGNIFNKIGAIALIVAFIFFIKLVSPYIVITDTMKIILGFFAGLGMFFGGLHLHVSEKFKNYSEVLIGTGFATLFISSFCAYYLKVFNTPAAIISGTLLLLLVFFVSHKMRSVSSLIIGLLGGYLTPYLSGAAPDISFGYLIFLNIVSIIYALNNPKLKWINIVNLSITMLILFAGCITYDSSKITYPLILWGCYIIYDLMRDRLSGVDNATGVLNYIFLTLITLTLFKTSVKSVGIMFGLTALVYAILAFVGKRLQHPLYKRFEHCIFLNVWFSILFTLNDLYSIITWSIVALMLSFALKKDKLNAVKHYITVYYLSAMFGIFLAKDGSSFMLFEQYKPILNTRSLIFLIPVLSMGLSIARLRAKEIGICNNLRFNVMLLLYAYLMCEVTNVLKLLYPAENSGVAYPHFMIYTLIGFLYSVLLYSTYQRTKSLWFNISSVLLGTVSVIMFIIACFMHSGAIIPVLNLRVLAFFAGLYYCLYFAKATGANFFKYLAVFMGFLLCGAESSLFDSKFNTGYITTLGWLLYSGFVTLAGMLKSKKFLLSSGIWILIFTILRVFIYDLANVESIYKILAFLSLGVVLMLISYVYVKLRNDK